jgi:hypothetical protein
MALYREGVILAETLPVTYRAHLDSLFVDITLDVGS